MSHSFNSTSAQLDTAPSSPAEVLKMLRACAAAGLNYGTPDEEQAEQLYTLGAVTGKLRWAQSLDMLAADYASLTACGA